MHQNQILKYSKIPGEISEKILTNLKNGQLELLRN